MISDLWTLQAASGGDEKTLAEWGFSSATLSRANQEADTLTLSAAVADAMVLGELWDFETQLILRRDGEVYYRGYVARVPLSLTPGGDMVTHELRNIWWLLDRLTYRQDWTSLTGTGTGTVSTGRVRLGSGEGGATAAAMVAELVAYAASLSVPLTVDTSLLPATPLPLIEGHNRTVGELLREIFKWIPETTLTARYTDTGTTLRAVSVLSAPVSLINVAGKPLSDLRIETLHEMQVDAVRVDYETTAPRSVVDEATETTPGGFRRADALVVASDKWPASAPITRRSLTVTLPHPAPLTPVIPTPQITSQPVSTETWPAQGAFSNAAERWWLDRSELGTMGLTINDIRLPRAADETTILHRVIIDPAIPVSPPSAVNPNSTPVWRPDTPEDTPRELMAGSLADWMNVKQTFLIAQVTIAVRKSTADALAEPNKSAFFRLGPREVASIAGVDIPTYLIDASYKFRATDAVTKVYEKVISIDYDGGTPAAQNQAAYDAAVESAVVPGLAKRLYESMSPLYHAGAVTLTAEEAPAQSYLGRTVRLVHPSRPEWSAMRTVVQQESVNLDTGEVALTLGPPQHLAPQDWVALHAAARQAQERRTVAAAAPVPRSTGDISAPPEPESLAQNPVIGSTYAPQANFRWLSGGTAANHGAWHITSTGDGSFTISVGTILKGDDSVSAVVTCTNPNDEFTGAPGKYLAIKIELKQPASYTLVLLNEWPEDAGAPVTYDGTVATADFEFIARYYPLWQFAASSSEPDTVSLGADLVAIRIAPRENLVIQDSLYKTPDGEIVPLPRFGISHRAISL